MTCPECGSERIIVWKESKSIVDIVEYICEYCGMIFEEN